MQLAKHQYGEKRRCSSITVVVVLCLFTMAVLLPSWAIDRAPFGGDQSQYARASIDLYQAWQESSRSWLSSMIGALPSKGPGIAWIGQAFVGLGYVTGDVNRSLLLLTIGAIVTATALLGWSVWKLSEGRVALALSAALLALVSPGIQFIAQHYLIEPLQLLAVCWFLMVFASSRHWHPLSVLTHLAGASAFAVLAKPSTPLYCLVPGLVALVIAAGNTWRGATQGFEPARILPSAVVAVVLLIAASAWYLQNIDHVAAHVATASSGKIAAVWGRQDTFLGTFAYWLGTFRNLFFTPLTFAVFAATTTLGAAVFLIRPRLNSTGLNLASVVATVQIAVVLVVFSFQDNRSPRFLIPVLPYVGILFAWSLWQLRSLWLPRLLVVGLVLYTVPTGFSQFAGVDRIGARDELLREVVARTCFDGDLRARYSIVAVDASFSEDWFLPDTVDYVAAREQLLSGRTTRCRYGYLGDGFFGDSVENSWASILRQKPRYIVIRDPATYPPPERPFNVALGRGSANEMMRLLRSGGRFEEIGPLSLDGGVLVFRWIDWVERGRRLLDTGEYFKGIDALIMATRLEPNDAEAWANLQLGYLRAEKFADAIEAGIQTLRLSPSHPYALQMLGEAYLRTGQQTKADEILERAKDIASERKP